MSGPPLVCGGSGVGYRLAFWASSRAAPAPSLRDDDTDAVVLVVRPRA